MKLVIFGLGVTSSWGNGHATLWRGLLKALARRGHRSVFYERDVPWYADSRDLTDLPGCRIALYDDWAAIRSRARADLRDADAAVVTSYCPDGVAASELVTGATRPARLFYDLDTPVTLEELAQGRRPPWLGVGGLRGFDLVLSFTGGAALDGLRRELGATRVAPLYGSVDPALHRPQPWPGARPTDLGYIGTYAADRQPALEALLIEPARRRPARRFTIAGAQYPAAFPWTPNIFFVRHLPPAEHAAFYASSRATLNVTRAAMARLGFCPSGRMFEAAACGVPLLSDDWQGIETFYQPEEEILIVRTAEDTLAALDRSDAELQRMAARARERTLELHSADQRAGELLRLIDQAAGSRAGGAAAIPGPARHRHLAREGAEPCGA